MFSYTYTKTEELLALLSELEQRRVELAALILSREDEIRYRWESLILQVFYIPALYDLSVRKSDVLKTFMDTKAPVTRYSKLKDAIRFIDENWFVNTQPVKGFDLKQLYEKQWKTRMTMPEHELDDHLDYLQSSNDHPVVQAFMAQAVIFNLKPFAEHNEEFSHLVFLLFLYKTGYTFRKFLVIEDFFYHERVFFKDLASTSFQTGNLTMYIEYSIQATIKSLEKLILGIREKSFSIPLPKIFFELSSRQKEILSSIDGPEMAVTNKDIQKMFKVSQITASRELSKLVELGLLFSEGKGRGIRYKLA